MTAWFDVIVVVEECALVNSPWGLSDSLASLEFDSLTSSGRLSKGEAEILIPSLLYCDFHLVAVLAILLFA